MAIIGWSVIDSVMLSWYPASTMMAVLGLGLGAYNGLIRLAIARIGRRWLIWLAGVQIVMDLGCLTLLTLWTGGMSSPLTGMYVFHMIFASLLLSGQLAYTMAAAAIVMLIGGLIVSGQSSSEKTLAAGWMVTVLLTVYLTNHITQGLRRQQAQLVARNRRIRRMGRWLRRQEKAMAAQEKMAALGQMAAGITHEIANPLAGLDAMLQVMQRKPEKLDGQSVEKLRGQVARINGVVREISTFAHGGEEHWETLPINEVVESAIRMVSFDSRMDKLKLQKYYAESIGSIRMMPQALRQVLVNLLTNALDAMEQVSRPQLEIRTERNGPWCLIRVTDNGHGIAPGHIERVFEPFFTTKPMGKGTGIGLSISYSLMRRQGGQILVSSRPGQGSTFTVRLPAGEAAPRPVVLL